MGEQQRVVDHAGRKYLGLLRGDGLYNFYGPYKKDVDLHREMEVGPNPMMRVDDAATIDLLTDMARQRGWVK